jgi:MFS family permease
MPSRFGAFDRRLLLPLVLGAALNPINSSIIAVSLVPIGRAFGAPSSDTAWLVSALYLATATGQPVVGRLVDRHGPRPLLLLGSTLNRNAGLIGALAPSLGVLIGARVLLGFGTCAGYPAAMALIRRESERTGEDRPAAVLTVLTVSSQTVVVVGPTLGGLLIGAGGWRTTLAINVPVALVALVAGWLRLPRATPSQPGARSPVDAAGIALFAATLSALLLFLMLPAVAHLWLLGLAAVLAAAFVARERRVADPFVDLRALRANGPLTRTYARTFLAATVSYAVLYGVGQWLQDGRGLSATAAGLVLTPLALAGLAVSALTGSRPEIRGKLVVGSWAQLVGCALLLLLGTASPMLALIGVAVVFGVPQGLLNLANQNAVYHQADPERLGASAGLLRTCTYLGAIASATGAATFFGTRADTAGLHQLALALLACSALLLLLTFADRDLSRTV